MKASENFRVRKYSQVAVIEHSAFIIGIIGLMVTGLPPFINWFFKYISIYTYQLPVIPNWSEIHILFGIFTLGVGLFFFAYHISQPDNEVLKLKPKEGLGNVLQSVLYLFGLSHREGPMAVKKMYNYEKIKTIILIYILGFTLFTGVLLMVFPGWDQSVLLYPHMIGAVVTSGLVVFHVLLIIRRWDATILRCMFTDGTLPSGYVRRSRKLWFRKLKPHEKVYDKGMPTPKDEDLKDIPQDTLALSIKKLYEIYGEDIDPSILKRLHKTLSEEVTEDDKARLEQFIKEN